jgi:hypothetical protein
VDLHLVLDVAADLRLLPTRHATVSRERSHPRLCVP